MAMTEHVHCIGIGGIGVSALARLYRSRGWRVSGSDLVRSEITAALRKEGIRVFLGPHRASHLAPSVTRVIYTAAASSPVAPSLLYSSYDRRKSTTGKNAVRPKRENAEIREARRRRIPAQSYAQAIGELTRHYRTIAVAGAHGKSTTTALIALTMARAGLDPTVIVGTKLREFENSNFRPSQNLLKSDFNRFWGRLVLEADEHYASFLNYSPAVAVVTNIDREHLDYFRTIGGIETAFRKFLLCLTPGGTAVLNRDDPRLRRAAAWLRRARPDLCIVWYSLKDSAARKIRNVIRIPGRHNVSNALAVRAVGRLLKIPESKILAAIGAYRGAWRRFDYQGRFSGAKVFADYAHHPTEIKATLQAAREKFPKRRIWCVFQPHHYERTRDLFHEFSRAFRDCDGLILLDIYEVAGRERPARPLRQSFSEASRRGGKRKSAAVSSERLARAVSRNGTPALYLSNPARLRPFLADWLRSDDVVLMMGAGSIWEMTKRLMAR